MKDIFKKLYYYLMIMMKDRIQFLKVSTIAVHVKLKCDKNVTITSSFNICVKRGMKTIEIIILKKEIFIHGWIEFNEIMSVYKYCTHIISLWHLMI